MRDPRVLLQDIVAYCEPLGTISTTHSRAQFEADWFVYQASLRSIEIIGEAVKGLPDEIRALKSEIPWSKIARMRDIVAHHYFGIDNDAIWDVVTVQAPELLKAVSEMISDLDLPAET